MTALTAAGCPYEFVPGISSALAAPLMAGQPAGMAGKPFLMQAYLIATTPRRVVEGMHGS
eukprot:786249-Pelagomonas_calceolata.AAC.8